MSHRVSRSTSSSRAIPELRAGILRALSRFPEVQAIYLFGSVAAGTSRADSDVDVAVVTAEPLGMLKVDMQAALVGEGIDNVDLVSLATDDLVLKFEAVRQHCLLFARDTFDPGSYYSRILREYSDFLPYLERQRKAMKQRMRHGEG